MNVDESWGVKNTDWREFARFLEYEYNENKYETYRMTNANGKLEWFTTKVNGVYKQMLQTSHRFKPRRGWWTNELRKFRRKAWDARRVYQRARKRGSEVVERLQERFRNTTAEYKKMLRKTKTNY